MNLPGPHKTRNLLVYIFLIAGLISCGNEKNNTRWDRVKINPGIARDPIYSQLDKQEEIYSVFEEEDSFLKKSSDVAYFSGEKINTKDHKNSKFNNCRAYLSRADTLSINIGISNGFSGWGFSIHYSNKNFYTTPYSFDDIAVEGELPPAFNLIYQQLILDKPNYKMGDSLYGKIEFKSIGTDQYNKRTEHFAIGNFRAKVEKGSIR